MHRVVYIWAESTWLKGDRVERPDLSEALDGFAREGWEVVSLVPAVVPRWYLVTLRRESDLR